MVKGALVKVRRPREESHSLISKHLSSKKRKPKLPFSFERKKFGGIRMCQRCLRTKPDRCHHCSQCNQCILKMDHHCPWVANCIGFFNYKYFMNMLIYTSLTTWLVLLTTWDILCYSLTNDLIDYRLSYAIATSYLLCSSLALVISGFLCFHLWLIYKQYTTIEFCEKRSDNDSNFKTSPYNRGLWDNFRGVFGENPLLWFVPLGKPF